jgi:hypothetical protein
MISMSSTTAYYFIIHTEPKWKMYPNHLFSDWMQIFCNHYAIMNMNETSRRKYDFTICAKVISVKSVIHVVKWYMDPIQINADSLFTATQ